MIRKILGHFAQTVIFGIEDSLVSTVGLLSGIVIGGLDRSAVILTGMVLIFVEALSMAAGSFLSEASAEEIANSKKDGIIRHSFVHGILMFFSYFIAGFIPLFPYVIRTISNPLEISIITSLIALFILGAASARAAKISIWKIGLRMFIIGGLAIGVGIAVGAVFGK